MRPSASDLLAYQLEKASTSTPKSSNNSRPPPLSAPPSSSFSLASPSSYASSASPATPATPWSDNTPLIHQASQEKLGTGLGFRDMATNSSLPSGKLQGRGGVSKARVVDSEEGTDEDLEDELNDFGYGTRVKRKEKKESLLDMLSSEPPSWMVEAEPVPVSIPTRRGSTLPRKLRNKFSSTPSDVDLHAGFTTLQRGGSKNKKENQGSLRASRSASNLLNSFRTRTNTFASRMSGNRSREDLNGSIDLKADSVHSKKPSTAFDEDEFERLVNSPESTPPRRLTAKDASSKLTSSTRDLADFLRSSNPPFATSTSSLSLADTESSRLTGSTNARSTGSADNGGGGQGQNASIVRAAMVKLGGAGRRASIGSSTSFANLVSRRPATSSGIPRLSPTSNRFKNSRPSTGQTVASDESLYDPQNKETIQVDDSLMRGMFGKDEEERQETLRGSALGVYEFVELDQRESGGKSPELHRLGSLTKSKSMGNVSTARRISVTPSDLNSSALSSASRITSPRRKPVPLVSNVSDPGSWSRSPTSPVRSSAIPKLVSLQERDDTSPIAVGESPVKGSTSFRAGPLPSSPFSSLVPTTDILTPTTPFEMYETPPLTPATPAGPVRSNTAPPSTASSKRLSLSTISARAPRSRETSSDTTYRSERPTSPPPDLPLPATPSRPSSVTSSRKESFRPRSIILQPTEPSAKRLSMIQVSDVSPILEINNPLPPTNDSPLDPPLSAVMTPRPDPKSPELNIDDPLIAALESLRLCMSQTATLPLDLASLSSATKDNAERSDTRPRQALSQLVPTLRGMQQSMEYGSKLLGAILDRLEGQHGVASEDGDRDDVEARRVVGALLGEDAEETWESATGSTRGGRSREVSSSTQVSGSQWTAEEGGKEEDIDDEDSLIFNIEAP